MFFGNACSLPADVFSVGIIMWELWHGKRAYRDGDNFTHSPFPLEFASKVMNQNLRPRGFSSPEELDQDDADKWKRLMESCWASQSGSRPTAREVYKEFERFGV